MAVTVSAIGAGTPRADHAGQSPVNGPLTCDREV
jgi:hypothetical protein